MIDDDATMFRRFKAWTFVLPPDLREWVIEILEDTVSRVQRRGARDCLLRLAGEKIGGTPYRQARELLRLQLWILSPGQTRDIAPGSIEALVAEALSHWPHAVRLGRLKAILKDGQSCP